MVYDASGVLLFGGYNGDSLGHIFGDTWEWDGSRWIRKCDEGAPCNNGMSPRYLHSMAYDEDRRVTVLFSGRDGQPNSETWEWNGQEWTLKAEGGPSHREDSAMIYEPIRGMCVLFGGYDGIDFVNDTWGWNGQAWVLIDAGGPGDERPSPRYNHGMCYDRDRGVTVLFGGFDHAKGLLGDTWELGSTGGWHQVFPQIKPSPRERHDMTYDETCRRSLLFGGWDGSESDETWAWDGQDWRLLNCPVKPSPRYDHAIAYDVQRKQTVLFGGQISGDPLGDTWELRTRVIDCDLVTGLKAKCKYGHGRFKVRAKVITQLPEGTQLGLCLDHDECILTGNEECKDVVINARGSATAKWTTPDKGDHCIFVRECPDIHRGVTCGP